VEYKMVEVSDFIDQVLQQDFAKAQPTFADIMGDKMGAALDQEKIAVAGQIFNGEEPEPQFADEEQLEMDLDDVEEEDFDDEELEDGAEEALEDDEE